VREAGQIVDCAVRVAVGITAEGKRRVLSASVALSEAEVHWRTSRVKLIVSDDHAGLKAARCATLPSVPWQRCQFWLTTGPKRIWLKASRHLTSREATACACAPPTAWSASIVRSSDAPSVASILPNAVSRMRFVSALLAESDEQWLEVKSICA
jgi:transposase-like protein